MPSSEALSMKIVLDQPFKEVLLKTETNYQTLLQSLYLDTATMASRNQLDVAGM
jgi:hypothetical protein